MCANFPFTLVPVKTRFPFSLASLCKCLFLSWSTSIDEKRDSRELIYYSTRKFSRDPIFMFVTAERHSVKLNKRNECPRLKLIRHCYISTAKYTRVVWIIGMVSLGFSTTTKEYSSFGLWIERFPLVFGNVLIGAHSNAHAV